MAGHISVMFGWSWNDFSVFGRQLFGQASAERFGVYRKMVEVEGGGEVWKKVEEEYRGR